VRNIEEDALKRTGLQRVVLDSHDMRERSVMPEPDVAAFLTDHPVAEILQDANQTIPDTPRGSL
jgi:hypothetical protein